MHNWNHGDRSASSGGTSVESSVPGVIDTLGLGYATLVAKPLVMVPLLLVDFLVLFAPRVSAAPVADAIARQANGRGLGLSDVRQAADWMSGYNVVELSALQAPLIRMPAISPSFSSERAATYGWHMSLASLPFLLVAGISFAAIGLGLLLTVVFRLLIASEGLGTGSPRDAVDPQILWIMALRLVGWASAIIGLLLLIGMPILVVTGLGMVFGFGGSPILWLVMLLPIAWGFVHFHFSIHAMFVDRIGPFDALRSSYLVVRDNFWQSVQFIAITMLIMTGVTYALRQMAQSGGGAVAATVINTFVATGIVVAAMLFYRDRARQIGTPVEAPGR
jgi:hypothetical protein